MKEIKHSEMVTGLAKNGQDIIDQLTPKSMHLLHMAVGIAGEAGELLEAIDEKVNFEDIDVGNIIEELGDMEFYLEGYRQGLDIDRRYTTMFIDEPDYSVDYGSNFDFSMSIFTNLAMHTGRLLDDTKKTAIYVKEINRISVIENLINIENCLEGIRQVFGVIHSHTLSNNVDKLGKRYKGHLYTNEQAQDRADKA